MTLFKTPRPQNEPIKSYAPGSEEKRALKEELSRQQKNPISIPLIIGGKEIHTNLTEAIYSPHATNVKLGTYSKATKEEVQMAIRAAAEVYPKWSTLPWEERASIFLKAADLLATKYRPILNAATMLGQSKTVYQAEIDAACELIDFFRFNVHYMKQIYNDQPEHHSSYNWNRIDYRPLEGFIFAVTPFNFTAIGGNLVSSPAMVGNVVLWKPASTAVTSAYYVMKILKEAGLPDGVINFLPGSSSEIAPTIFNHPDLAGIHFTGSTKVFQSMWKSVGDNLGRGIYKSYPRIVGETGGKDFVFAYPDACIKSLSVALIRGAFEYQGQKCSAASRAYIPKSVWPKVQHELFKMAEKIGVGDVSDFTNFMGAVIDKSSYDSIVSYINYAKESKEAKIIFGGKYDDRNGYFIHPTIVETTNPKFRLMEEEIFGPVLTIYPYDDSGMELGNPNDPKLKEILKIVDSTSPYALTGAIFAQDRFIINALTNGLRNSAGNFYINDKPTGAVVGQQPFGGARASGTNDKAGSYLNLLRWISPRTIKENFVPIHDFTYPSMQEK